jgi:fused signal recognition particle receptor
LVIEEMTMPTVPQVVSYCIADQQTPHGLLETERAASQKGVIVNPHHRPGNHAGDLILGFCGVRILMDFSEARKRTMWGFVDKLKKGLSKTHQGLVEKIDRLFLGKKTIDQDVLEELEAVLFAADLGVKTSNQLIEGVQQGLKRGELQEPEKVKEFIKKEILRILKSGEKPLQIDFSRSKPFVFMVVGVNGVGKTTTIGKLAHQYASEKKRVLIGAADTFRAAAVEQLEIWAKRVGADFIRQEKGSDPAAVAFDSIKAAMARGNDLVFIDTAGRLHTKVNLMEEVKKLKRIISRECPGAPHEILLVLDATTGQNAISQAKLFMEAIGVTGIAITKLDGTAKGGIIVGITEELGIPIRYIGVGEGIDDLKEFNATDFVEALFSSDASA